MMHRPSSYRGSYRRCFSWNISAIKTICLLTVLFLPGMVSAAEQERGVDRVLRMHGIAFHVLCPNQGSLNTLTIVPSGLKEDNSAIKKEIDGSVTGVEVADLNGDGSPEVYVYINSAGSGSYGTLVAYSANKKKSLSEIYLPPLEDDPENSKGYMGHDRFKVSEGVLVRSFPVYNPGDSNATPTGGTRSLEYQLVAGEAGFRLEVVKSSVH